jgi:hypothetical protein
MINYNPKTLFMRIWNFIFNRKKVILKPVVDYMKPDPLEASERRMTRKEHHRKHHLPVRRKPGADSFRQCCYKIISLPRSVMRPVKKF